jgi:hypothetical protein
MFRMSPFQRGLATLHMSWRMCWAYDVRIQAVGQLFHFAVHLPASCPDKARGNQMSQS